MNRLNLLLVEDSDDDFELMRRELDKSPDRKLLCTRAQTEAEVREALSSQRFDIVVSDYSIRGFNALGVLRLIEELHPQLPCVIVSGTIGEETAVNAIRAGAKDYILKDRPGRLVTAVEREVRRYHAQRAQDLLSKASHDALWDWDLKTDKLGWSEGLTALFGHPVEPKTLTGAWWIEQIHPDDRDRVVHSFHAMAGTNQDTWISEYRFRRADGTYAYVLDRGNLIRDDQGQLVRGLGAMVDLSPQKHAELKILASAQQLRQAQHLARMGSFEFDVNRNTYTVSEEFYRLCEISSGTDVDLNLRMRAVHPDDQERVLKAVVEALASSQPYTVEYRMTVPSGIKHVHAHAEPVRDAEGKVFKYVGILQDVSERVASQEALQQNEEQLRQLQKMDAIGRLAGGIAHDYNNLLAAIQMNCELAQDEATPAVAESLEQIQSIVRRGASLTRQLLLFSRKQPRSKKSIDLNLSIQHIEKMLIRLIGETIQLKASGPSDLWPIEADPAQIDQILLNVAVNARDAMPGGGLITITTRNLELTDEELHPAGLDLKPGSYVHLAISDTGCGMSTEIQGKIFEPFFTTKPVGQGTGLGLPTVYGIVKEHGGAIGVESKVGSGSVFNFYFPASFSVPEIQAVPEPAPAAPRAFESAGVLVVEDEPDLRRSLEKILRQRGFDVILAQDGQEALALFALHAARIRIVVSDLTMPVLGGIEMVEQIRSAKPEMPVIFMSGHTENHQAIDGMMGNGRTRFITKPFSGKTIRELIQELLNDPAS